MIQKRFISSVGVLLLALTAIGFSRGQALAQTLSGYDAYVYSAIVNLRETPSAAGALIAVLQRGDHMNLDGRTDDSVWVHVKTEYNQVGWLAKSFLFISTNVVIADLPILAKGEQSSVTAPTAAPGQPTAAGSSGSTPPPPVVTGKTGGTFELGGQVRDLGRSADAMRRSGMTWVKRQVSQGDGGATGLINEAHTLGFKILLSVVGDKGSVVNDDYQNTYAGYVGTLAGAGADGIEIWNEMNIDREWPTGQISPASYVRLLAKAYNAVKVRNRGTIVIIGAPAPTGAEGAFGLDRVWNDDRYTAGLVAAGASQYADCVGIHYNEGVVPPTQRSGDPRGDNYPTRYFYSMLSRGLAGFGLPACFTELGYLSPEGYGPLPGGFAWAANVTVQQQAAWLAGAAVAASNSARVRLMIVFNVDFQDYGADPMGGYAMIRPNGTCMACDTLGSVMR